MPKLQVCWFERRGYNRKYIHNHIHTYIQTNIHKTPCRTLIIAKKKGEKSDNQGCLIHEQLHIICVQKSHTDPAVGDVIDRQISGISDLCQKWVRSATNGTNPGLFQIRF